MPLIKNNEFRAGQAIMILRIIIVFDIVMVMFDLLELNLILRLLRSETVGLHAERHNEIRQLLISIFYTIVSFCSGLAFWGWLHRSYSNINRLGLEKTRYKPLWTVLSFLIPFVNAFLPYFIVKETYHKTVTSLEQVAPGSGTNLKSPALATWWIFWLLSILSSLVYLLMLKLPLTRDHRLTLTCISIFSDIIDIPAALYAIAAVKRINEIEKQLYLRTAA